MFLVFAYNLLLAVTYFCVAAGFLSFAHALYWFGGALLGVWYEANVRPYYGRYAEQIYKLSLSIWKYRRLNGSCGEFTGSDDLDNVCGLCSCDFTTGTPRQATHKFRTNCDHSVCFGCTANFLGAAYAREANPLPLGTGSCSFCRLTFNVPVALLLQHMTASIKAEVEAVITRFAESRTQSSRGSLPANISNVRPTVNDIDRVSDPLVATLVPSINPVPSVVATRVRTVTATVVPSTESTTISIDPVVNDPIINNPEPPAPDPIPAPGDNLPTIAPVYIYTKRNNNNLGPMFKWLMSFLVVALQFALRNKGPKGKILLASLSGSVIGCLGFYAQNKLSAWWNNTTSIGMLTRPTSDDCGQPTRSLLNPLSWSSNVHPLAGYTGYRQAPVFTDIAHSTYLKVRGGSKVREDTRRFVTSDICRALATVPPDSVPDFHRIMHNTAEYLFQRLQEDSRLNPTTGDAVVNAPY